MSIDIYGVGRLPRGELSYWTIGEPVNFLMGLGPIVPQFYSHIVPRFAFASLTTEVQQGISKNWTLTTLMIQPNLE